MTGVQCPSCERPRNPNRPSCHYCWNRLPVHLRRGWAILTRRTRPVTPAVRERITAEVEAWLREHPSTGRADRRT